MKLSTIIFASLFLMMTEHASAAVYKCNIDGVTSYSQMPCEDNTESKGMYQSSGASLTYKSIIKPDRRPEQQRTLSNEIDLAGAIFIRQESCNRDTYSGIVVNTSRYSTYKVTITVKFKYYKTGMEKKDWDKKQRIFNLKPGQSINFSIKGRRAPSSYNMECETTRSIKLTASTIKH